MPTYEYECDECGQFDVEQKLTDPPLIACPRTVHRVERPPTGSGFSIVTCRRPVRRLIAGAPGFVLKGKGWFKDGY